MDPDDTLIPEAPSTIPSPPPSGAFEISWVDRRIVEDWDGFASDALDELD